MRDLDAVDEEDRGGDPPAFILEPDLSIPPQSVKECGGRETTGVC